MGWSIIAPYITTLKGLWNVFLWASFGRHSLVNVITGPHVVPLRVSSSVDEGFVARTPGGGDDNADWQIDPSTENGPNLEVITCDHTCGRHFVTSHLNMDSPTSGTLGAETKRGLPPGVIRGGWLGGKGVYMYVPWGGVGIGWGFRGVYVPDRLAVSTCMLQYGEN